jgi:hypothetical protein
VAENSTPSDLGDSCSTRVPITGRSSGGDGRAVHQQQPRQGGVGADGGQRLGDRARRRRARRSGHLRGSDEQQRPQHREVADRVGEEDTREADERQGHSRERGADGRGAREDDRLQGEGGEQLLLRHELGDQGASGRLIEAQRRALQEGEHHDHPHLDDVQQGQHAEQHRKAHAQGLREEQKAPLVDAIGHGAAEEREDEERERLRQRYRAERERRAVRELQHEQRLRDDLHPRADRGAHQPHPQDPEVAVPQDVQRPAVHRRGLGGRRRRHGFVWFLPRRPCANSTT